jgi:predicted secreted protein
MTIRMLAAGLALALAVGGCSKPADPAAGGNAAGPARSGRPQAPKPSADPMASAIAYDCYDGSKLHVVFDRVAGSALVRLDDDSTVNLPREPKADLEAYTDGGHTLGVSASGELAYTEAPAPPIVCRAPDKEQAGDQAKDPARNTDMKTSGETPALKGKEVSADPPASKNLPAPRASGVTRNFTAADKGKTIEMKVGEKVSISLVGIPTAGYVWAADTTPSIVKVTDGPSGPTIAAQNQAGYTGGNHWEVLVVEAVKAGEGDLVLAMRRPWENKAEKDAETFTVKVKVE